MTQDPSPDSWRRLYPFQSHFLDVNGHRYHYLDEGKGDPVLMVHGNPTWSFYWRKLIQEFRSDFRMVAPDHLGCGFSDKPANAPYTLAMHIENLVSLIHHLDLHRVTLMVHDWGGAIGLGAAIQQPQRISRIVLFNTAAFPPPYIPWRIQLCRIPGLGKLAIQGFNAFARGALWMAVENRQCMNDDERRGMLAPYDSWNRRIANYRFVRDIPASPSHPTWKTLESIERQLSLFAEVPTKIVWGMRDWCFRPSCLQRLIELLPHASVNRMESAGHYVVQEAHESIVPLIRGFLQPASVGEP